MGWIYFAVYMLVMFVFIFVLCPYLKARTDIFDDEMFLAFGIIGSMFWPITIIIVAGGWLFNKSEKYFKIKEPLPPVRPRVNAAKSSYRKIAYHEETDLDDNEYTPFKEI